MAILTPFFMEAIAKYIDDKVHSADYTIGNQTRPIKIRRSIISGSMIKKHVYLTTKDPSGIVTRVRLLDKDGNVLAQLNDRIEHAKNTGRLFEFSFSIREG